LKKPEVVVIDADGHSTTLSSDARLLDPSLSGDGAMVAFLGSRGTLADAPAPPSELYVQNVRDEGSRRLLTRGTNLHDPDVLPDGSAVVLSATGRPNAGPPPPVPRPRSIESPRSGYRGRVVELPPADYPPARIYAVDVRSSAVTPVVPVVNADEDQELPAVSPDGRRLAYLATSRGTSGYLDSVVRVLTLGAPAPGTPILSALPSAIDDISWSPDGTALAVAKRDVGGGEITIVSDVGQVRRTVEAAGGVEVQLADATGNSFIGVVSGAGGMSSQVVLDENGRLAAGSGLPERYVRQPDVAECALRRG
jgi:Tol biopolymer transport system component